MSNSVTASLTLSRLDWKVLLRCLSDEVYEVSIALANQDNVLFYKDVELYRNSLSRTLDVLRDAVYDSVEDR